MQSVRYKTKVTKSISYPTETIDPSERLLKICLQARANTYISGPAAKDYLDVDIFRNNGVEVQWMEYSGYPEYPQFHPPFDHYVSVLDLIFNVGPNAQACMERQKMQLSIVTTLFKSQGFIYEFHQRICASANLITNDYEVIYVDDGSPDDSLKVAIEIQKKIVGRKSLNYQKILVIILQFGQGLTLQR